MHLQQSVVESSLSIPRHVRLSVLISLTLVPSHPKPIATSLSSQFARLIWLRAFLKHPNKPSALPLFGCLTVRNLSCTMYMHLPILGMQIQHKENLILYIQHQCCHQPANWKFASCQCTYQNLLLLVRNVVYKAGICFIIFVALAQVYIPHASLQARTELPSLQMLHLPRKYRKQRQIYA